MNILALGLASVVGGLFIIADNVSNHIQFTELYAEHLILKTNFYTMHVLFLLVNYV